MAYYAAYHKETKTGVIIHAKAFCWNNENKVYYGMTGPFKNLNNALTTMHKLEEWGELCK